MTKLFEEYELKKLAKENAHELIGKKFYWSHCNGRDLPRVDRSEFVIINIEFIADIFWVTYEYLHYGRARETHLLDEILNTATPIDD